jgi:hypothetical protein
MQVVCDCGNCFEADAGPGALVACPSCRGWMTAGVVVRPAVRLTVESARLAPSRERGGETATSSAEPSSSPGRLAPNRELVPAPRAELPKPAPVRPAEPQRPRLVEGVEAGERTSVPPTPPGGKLCPCGCGRTLKWRRRRAAETAVEHQVALRFYVQMLGVFRAKAPDDDIRHLEDAYETCHRAQVAMLRFAHDEPFSAGNIPSPGQLANQRQALGKGIVALTMMDSPFVETYRARLCPEHQKLVDSILLRYRHR